MAKIALISLYNTTALGLRYFASGLKKEGHEVSIIFLKKHEVILKKEYPPGLPIDEINPSFSSQGEFAFPYPRLISEKEWRYLINFLIKGEFDFVGLSVFSNFINTARAVTKRIKDEVGIKVIWGGMEPTIRPEFNIQFADYLCIGEGDEAIIEFADKWDKGEDLTAIPNIWVKEHDTIYRNKPRPLIQKLDELPFPDYTSYGKYEISDNEIRTHEWRKFWDSFIICASRGCPNKCAYCINNVLHKIYEGQPYIRRHSIDYVISALKEVKEKYRVRNIRFFDDIFTIDKKWLENFLTQYKGIIDLPYWIFVSPQYCSSSICKILKESGNVEVRMGVQSGSNDVLINQYKRNITRETVLQAARNLADVRIKYEIDIISNNPFETEEDCKETLDLLLSLPKPLRISGDSLSLLTFFPNYEITKLYEKNKANYQLDKKRYAFYNRLYLLSQYRSAAIIRKLEKSNYFRKYPEKLQYFFPIIPKVYRFLRSIIPKPIRNIIRDLINRIKNLDATIIHS